MSSLDHVVKVNLSEEVFLADVKMTRMDRYCEVLEKEHSRQREEPGQRDKQAQAWPESER